MEVCNVDNEKGCVASKFGSYSSISNKKVVNIVYKIGDHVIRDVTC